MIFVHWWIRSLYETSIHLLHLHLFATSNSSPNAFPLQPIMSLSVIFPNLFSSNVFMAICECFRAFCWTMLMETTESTNNTRLCTVFFLFCFFQKMILNFTIKLLIILSQSCNDSTLYCKQHKTWSWIIFYFLKKTSRNYSFMGVVKLGHMHNIMFAIQ